MGRKKQKIGQDTPERKLNFNTIWRKIRRKKYRISRKNVSAAITYNLQDNILQAECSTQILHKSFGSYRCAKLKDDRDRDLGLKTSCVDIDRNSAVAKDENYLNSSQGTKMEDTVYYLSTGQINSYELLDPIGRGSFGTVYCCYSIKERKNYAIKMVSRKRLLKRKRLSKIKNQSQMDMLLGLKQEINMLKSVNHPNVIRLFEVIDDCKVDNVYLIFELASRGPVITIPCTSGLEEDLARRYFRDALAGLKYLHLRNIAHLDIKPANLLLGDDGNLKISDFGVSHLMEQDSKFGLSVPGTFSFSSPEMITREHIGKDFDWRKSDIWSLGITLYCFIYGNVPWQGSTLVDLMHSIIHDTPKFPTNIDVNPKLTDLISSMLAKCPEDRIKMEEIETHFWVTLGGLYSLEGCEFSDNIPLRRIKDTVLDCECQNTSVESNVNEILLASPIVLERENQQCELNSDLDEDKDF